ncbi:MULTISPECIES: acetyl-CoA C-acetyltransferase [unclassified Microbulbifer]|uniref:acetyl-CoA C-acetyltransferase n=1 Tax=unclassified Microbulbifer TaxID=2619833 RepID=UPI001E36955F|nr:acetyl-CoA C-acetyltransferase [Microbulbifer sp. YPW16]UHQ54926.1 acetyl-CoA C-acetyltransferase [Microbulbifer sp. YPW16]
MLIGSPRRVAIVGANRIPFARSHTAYDGLSNQVMLTDTLRGLVDKYSLAGEKLDEVAGGAVQKHAKDWNLVRESVLGCGLDPHTPAYDIQQACGTSLEATILVANKIALGQIDCAIACGTDTTSDIPMGAHPGMRRTLLKINNARTTVDRLKAAAGLLDPRQLLPEVPTGAEPRTGMSMGQHAQVTATQWGITREAQDELALASHKNLARAYDEGFFDDLVMPYHGLERDNNLRPDSTMEKMAKLKPAFDRDNGTITAGNATPFTDGASAVLLASEEWAAARGLPVLAYITAGQAAAVDYVKGGEGLLMGGAYAIPHMLQQRGLSLQDFDFYEIHEAFAAVVLCTLAALESSEFCRDKLGLPEALGSIDRSRLNVNGSSIATGHPFAATGGRIVASLAKMLDQKGSGRGLISVCAAGGQAVTAILEK